MAIAKLLTIQEIFDHSEEWFKFVRVHNTEYGWAWKFSLMTVDHRDMVDEDECPLSAGFFGLENGKGPVIFPDDHINLPNYSTTLGINASNKDKEIIPLLFEGFFSEVTNGKYVESGVRRDNDSPAVGDEGEHGSSGS